MSADWPTVRLSDCASFQEGYVNPTQKKPDYFDGDIKWLRAVDLNNGYVKETTRSLTNAGFESAGKSALLFKPGTLAISKSGTIGRIGILQDYMCGNRAVINIKVNDEKCNNRFIFYVLLANRPTIENLAIGSVQKNLYTSALGSLEFRLPPRETQDVIAESLGSLDDKIELNRQTNQTLEHIAQAIFKSWFVDFEPTRAKIAAKQIRQARHDSERSAALREALLADGRWPEPVAAAIAEGDPERAAMAAISGKPLDELDQLSAEQQEQLRTTAALFPDALVDSELGEIPEGWAIAELGELLEFNPKRTLKKGVMAPYLDMKNVPTQGHLADDVYVREMASGTKFVNGDTLLARITPCLENGKTAYVDFLEEDQVAWGSTEYIVMRPKNGRPMSLGYIISRLDFFRSKAIQTMTGTSGRQRANAKALSEQEWINYPLELLKAYDRIAGSYLAKAKANGDENKILEKTKDTLLPKLLSGELSIESNQTELDKTA
jgi:type I restriction enzyme S subunit